MVKLNFMGFKFLGESIVIKWMEPEHLSQELGQCYQIPRGKKDERVVNGQPSGHNCLG